MVFVGRPGKVCWGPRYVLVGSGRGEFRLVCAGCRRGRPAIGEGGLSGTPVELVGHPGTPLPDPRSTGSGRQASGSTTRNRSWGLRALIGYPFCPGCPPGIPGPRPAETRRGTCGCSRGASSAQRPSTNRTAATFAADGAISPCYMGLFSDDRRLPRSGTSCGATDKSAYRSHHTPRYGRRPPAVPADRAD